MKDDVVIHTVKGERIAVDSERDYFRDDGHEVSYQTGVRATSLGVIPIRRTIKYERIDYIERMQPVK